MTDDEAPVEDAGAFFDADAAVYDARVDDPQWTADDAEFYRSLAADADGPALEVGVGTGRVYLELLDAGLDVDGVDVSDRMLDRLREKAAARGLDPSVRRGDVTELTPDREYGLVYVPARAFNHLVTLEDQRAALERILMALAPEGRLALNTFVPSVAVIADQYGEPQETYVSVDGETYRIVTTSTLEDEVEWIARIHRVIYDESGAAVEETATPLKLVSKREFELLFEVAGYSDWEVYGGFDRSPLQGPGDEQVWVVDR